MKNITHKYETERTATASAFVSMPAELRERVRRRDTEKGDALEIARVAAVMGAKKTWEIIPFCHPLLITRVDVDYDFVDAGIRVDVTASAVATTGVEMEAMTAAACCALTLYDMLKPYDAAVEITYTRLESKRGGKSDLGPRHLDPPLRAAVLCVSQAVLDGKKDDAAGDAVREQLERVGAELVVDEVLGADPAALSEQLIRLVEGSVELIVTVGGTGVGTDDFVVDVVRPLLDKELPGVAEAARSYGLRRTPRAMLSRSIAGIAGRTLIYTAPGSTSGARDSLTAIIAELTHAVDVVRKQQRGGWGVSLLSVDAALAEYAAKLPRLGAERVPVAGAVGRVLSADGVAATDLPPFDQSAMDGYAVLAADLAGAAPHRSVALEVGLEVAARAWAEHPTLLQGRCARIFTGAIVPEGADAVVAQEDVTRAQDLAEFAAPVARGHHVRPRGSELREGAVVARAGQRITPGLVGALAAAGSAHVDVVRRPRVALIVTGDEVVAPGQPLALGQVYDCNAPMAAAWLAGRGADVRLLSSRDTLEGTAAMVAGALDDADLVVTTGGVSVGEKDLVIAAAHRCGVEDHFWRVAQKPGKPLYFGSRGGVGVIGLPGNPAAVFVGLVAHVDAALRALEGRAEATRWRSGRLASAVRRGVGRDEWVRCAVDYSDAGVALRPLTGQASHMLSNLGECDGLALVRSGDGVVDAGSVVPWLPVAATG